MNLAKFYPLAMEVAELSKDPRTKVGAVVIDARGAVRAVGYNGFPRGVEDDPGRYADRDAKLLLVAHAEANAIANAAAVGTPLDGCGLVVTKYPCHECAKLVINAGIRQIGAPAPGTDSAWLKSNDIARMMFSEAGVAVQVVA
jgi:dCMP deaminase